MALLYLKHKLFPEPKQTKSKDSASSFSIIDDLS